MRWRWCRGRRGDISEIWRFLMIIDYDVCGRICIWRRGKRTSVSIRPQRGPVGFSRIYSSSFSSQAISSNWYDFRKNKTSVLNEALDFVKMWCEGIEERFSNNRVIVRPLSWLVCIGPFQPPNKGGTPTTEIQEILSPLSFFSPNKGGTPTTEIRKSFLHVQFFLQTRRGLQWLRSGNPFSTFRFFFKQGRDSNYWDPEILSQNQPSQLLRSAVETRMMDSWAHQVF